MSLRRLVLSRSLVCRPSTTLGRALSASFSSIQKLASDILPIKLANDETLDEDHPIFARDLLLQKLTQVKKDRIEEVLNYYHGPAVLASDVLPAAHKVLDTDKGAPAAVKEDEEVFLGSDMLLEKIQEAQTARVAEILEHNPGLFKIASDVLPLKVLDDDDEHAQVEQQENAADFLVQKVKEAQAVRIDEKLEGLYDQELASDILPIKALDVEAKLQNPGLGSDALLEKLQEVLALRIEEYEEKVVASDDELTNVQNETVKYAASKLKFGPELASDVLKRDKGEEVKLQGKARKSGPNIPSDVLPKAAA